VHNGEPAEKDEKSVLSNKPDHKRHASGSTLSSRAAAAILTVEEKIESAKQMVAKSSLGEKLKVVDEDENGGRPASIRSSMLGEPLVLHGWTLTAPVGFRAVCKTIRENAFTTSRLSHHLKRVIQKKGFPGLTSFSIKFWSRSRKLQSRKMAQEQRTRLRMDYLQQTRKPW